MANASTPRLTATFTMPAHAFDALDTAIPDTIDLVRDTRLGLLMIADAITVDGVDPDQPGVGALMRMIARALQLADTKEIPSLEQLDRALRRSRAARHHPVQTELAGGH